MFKEIELNTSKVVERAVRRGIDINYNYTVTMDGGKRFSWAPLHCAAYFGRSRILDILINNGAKVDMRDGMDGDVSIFFFLFDIILSGFD